MVTLRARKYGKDGQLLLSLRIWQNGRDNAIALGIAVDKARWSLISENIRQAKKAYSRGAAFIIDDQLTSKLWMLIKDLSLRIDTGGGMADTQIADYVRRSLHQEDVKAMEKAKEHEMKTGTNRPISFDEFVKNYIADCESGERLKHKSTRKMAEGTIRSYRGFLAQIIAYERARKRKLYWDDMTLDFYRDFKQYCIEMQYNPNTIARFVKISKTMLAAAKELHLTTRDDYTSKQWSVDFEAVENIYITSERIRQMAELDITDSESLIARARRYARKDELEELEKKLSSQRYVRCLAEARDIFVIGCLTGQRVSDYKRINTDMIETIVGERQFLHIVQVKTGKEVYVAVADIIKEILQRYGGKLPKVYDQHLNERIKVIGLLLGWTEPAGLHTRKGVMTFSSDKRFCDAIMTHTARRSFATNAYKAGVSLSAIMAITGHSSEEMLKKYLKLDSKEKALLAAREFDKVNTAM